MRHGQNEIYFILSLFPQIEMHSVIIQELLERESIREKLRTEDNWRGDQAPLHMSAALGNLGMVKMLLEAGANVNA